MQTETLILGGLLVVVLVLQLLLLLRNTVLYNLAFIIIGNVLQVFFAILLNEVQCKVFKKTTQSLCSL